MQMNMCEAINRLRNAGLRPARQRISLASMLFGGPERHISAEELHEEAVAANVPVSLATVYNTLNQFTEAGLLREVAIDGTKSYFDTNTSNHYHFYLESEGRLIDIDSNALKVVGLPEAPEGTKVNRIDVVVRLSDA